MRKTTPVDGQLNLMDFAIAEKEHKKNYNLEINKIRRRVVGEEVYLTDKQDNLTKEDFVTPKVFIESVLKRNFVKKFPELTIHSVTLKQNKFLLVYDLKQKEQDGHLFELRMSRNIKGANFDRLHSTNFDAVKEGLKDARKAFMMFAPALESHTKDVQRIWEEFKNDVDITKDKDIPQKFTPLTSLKYIKEPTASAKLQALYPGTDEFKYFTEEQAKNVLKLRQIEPFEKGDQLVRACKKIEQRIDSGALGEDLKQLTEGSIDSYYKAEKTLEQVEIKQDIIDQFSLEFPAIKYISLKAAEAISQYQVENEDFTSIKDVSRTYKKLGKQIDKCKDEFDKERITDDFRRLSIAVEGINQCKRDDIQVKNDALQAKQSKKMELEL